MRDLLLALVFFSSLPLILIRPFIGILIYFWASLMAPEANVWGFAAGIRYAFVSAAVTVSGWILFSKEPKRPPTDKLTALLTVLMIWISVTSWCGSGLEEDVISYWFNAEKILLMTLVAHTLLTNRERVDQLIAVTALSIGFYGFKGGVWVLLHGGQGPLNGPEGTTLGDNNIFGVAVTTILPLLYYLSRRYSNRYLKFPVFVVMGITVIGALSTYSRGVLLALSGVICLAWVYSRHKLAVGFLVIFVPIGVYLSMPAVWLTRMETIQTYDQDTSAQQRLYMWRLSWAIALEHPILGGGPHWSYNVLHVNQEFAGSEFHWPFGDQFGSAAEFSPPLTRPKAVHSIWFQMLSDGGFPGLLLFVAVLLSGASDARWLIRNARGHPHSASVGHLGRALLASLVAYMIGGSFLSFAMHDLPYAIVIVAAASRRIVAAEIAADAKLTRSLRRQTWLTGGSLIGSRPAPMRAEG